MGPGLKPTLRMSTADLECGWIAVKANEMMDKIQVGQVLMVICESGEKEEDVDLWLEMTGHELLRKEKTSNIIRFYVKKIK
jgi:TusA-related sulfurtransferase